MKERQESGREAHPADEETAGRQSRFRRADARSWFRPAGILALIYLGGILAVLRADFYYVDDMARAFEGYRSWTVFSRWVPEFLSVAVHADTYLTDISPLPQLLAVAVTAAAAAILLHIYTEDDSFSVWQYIALIPFGLSPYYLECLSYKFDSPYMALSVFFSVLPLLFREKSRRLYLTITAASVIGVCSSYQAATGIFPMAAVCLGARRWRQGENPRETAVFFRDSAAGYIAGILVYRFLLMRPADNYVSTSVPGIRELVPSALSHLKKYYQLIAEDFKVSWKIILLVLILGWLLAVLRESVRGIAASLAVSLISLAAMVSMAFGLYPLLEAPLFLPRAMYGFGVLLSLLALDAVSASAARLHTVPAKLACLALGWVFFVFSFSYGNALNVQKQYTDFRITAVVDDLDDLGVLKKGKKYIQIAGSIGKAPSIRRMPKDHVLLKRLVPVTFRGGWTWGAYGFLHYYDLKNVRFRTAPDENTREWKTLKKSIYHTIEKSGRYIRITLEE